MSKEKQMIEEMAKCCPYFWNGECTVDAANPSDCDLMCEMFGFMASLVSAGYRKQSEWISVDERLPDNCRSVLVALKGLTIGGAPSMVIGSYSGGFWMVADADGTHYLTKYMRYEVTHWMPLPEAPKMKGGAE